jgi:O-antigen ligase
MKMAFQTRTESRTPTWLPFSIDSLFEQPTTPYIVVAAALVMLTFIFLGKIMLLGALIAAIFFVVFTYYQPLPAVVLAMLFSTDVLKFVDLTYLPYISLGQGARLNAQDLVTLLLLGIGILRLAQRRERPLFLTPLLIWGGMVALSFVLGVFAHTAQINTGLNGLRSLSGYFFYIGLVGVIDSPRRFNGLIWIIFALLLVTVSIQLYETSVGARIVLPTSVQSEYFGATKVLDVNGVEAPYLWNRAVGYLFVGTFLALGAAFWKKNLIYAAIAVVGLLGFAVSLVREWYIFITVSLLVLMVLPRRGRWQAALGVIVVALLLLGVVIVLSNAGFLSSYPFLEVLRGRLETLTRFQQESNFLSRLVTYRAQLEVFQQTPFFGQGPGTQENIPVCCASDTGMPNTLVQYGLFGWLAILILIIAFFYRGFNLFRRMAGSSRVVGGMNRVVRELNQGYVAALLAIMVGAILAYSFSLDFFTSNEFGFTIGLVLALMDRFDAFAPRSVVASPRIRFGASSA